MYVKFPVLIWIFFIPEHEILFARRQIQRTSMMAKKNDEKLKIAQNCVIFRSLKSIR